MDDEKEQNFAVIAGDDRGHSIVLWHHGEQIDSEVAALGRHTYDLGLDDAPAGVTVWEGRYVWHPGSYECPNDGDSEAVGKFRAPTDDEWAAIRAGRNPWEHTP